MDQREEQRLQYETMRKTRKPKCIERDLSDEARQHFISEFRSDLAKGDMEMKKATVRSVIAKVLQLYPATLSVTGVKLASPRSFLPYLQHMQLPIHTPAHNI